MVLESLRQALKEEGIEEIPAEGETFDPNLHQAVQTVPATEDVPADTIVTVLQKGYKLHDRVLRAKYGYRSTINKRTMNEKERITYE